MNIQKTTFSDTNLSHFENLRLYTDAMELEKFRIVLEAVKRGLQSDQDIRLYARKNHGVGLNQSQISTHIATGVKCGIFVKSKYISPRAVSITGKEQEMKKLIFRINLGVI